MTSPLQHLWGRIELLLLLCLVLPRPPCTYPTLDAIMLQQGASRTSSKVGPIECGDGWRGRGECDESVCSDGISSRLQDLCFSLFLPSFARL
ncbi:hypothetical protein HDK90DRAFT_488946 [Phyllosticta capitalensis]|uniref:Secreted protein n=1 Tax=Phyllosticta capitalensis TaxID=121624 RepID=A0ABR1YKK4_9PEZI